VHGATLERIVKILAMRRRTIDEGRHWQALKPRA
jgi:hypothetical protein